MRLTLLFLLLLPGWLHAQKSRDSKLPPPGYYILDLDSNKRMRPFTATQLDKSWKMDSASAEKAFAIFSRYIDGLKTDTAREKPEDWDNLAPIDHYIRQVMGATNSKGEHIVCINALCRTDYLTDTYIRRRLMLVYDGGSCYFNVKVNIDTGEVTELSVNGLG